LLAILPLTTAFPLLPSLLSRDLASDTQNDLVNGTPCKKITVLFARGTSSSGNMGTSTGPPFVQAIGALVGTNNIAVQGIDYPATVLGFLQGGDTAGGTKVVMSGYSQGGQLVHKAAKQLSASVSAKVSSVVIFGDPDNGTAVGTIDPAKVLIVCHDGDLICEGSIIITPAHSNYANDAASSAAFVVKAAG
ncbi:putative cutinase, partial [Bisporella sp. PMI_857]